VTATEAERNRRRGLTPWWRVRSWSKDLDTLIRLHKSLRALDADAGTEQEPLSAPALSAPPAELLAPPQDEVAQEDDGPEPSPVTHQASYPGAAYPHETTAPVGNACHEAPGAGLGEAGAGQPDDVPVQVTAGPDPAIAAIKETFRYVADAG
jgi:hypothetical protein